MHHQQCGFNVYATAAMNPHKATGKLHITTKRNVAAAAVTACGFNA